MVPVRASCELDYELAGSRGTPKRGRQGGICTTILNLCSRIYTN